MITIQALHQLHGIMLAVLSLVLVIYYMRKCGHELYLKFWIYAIVSWTIWYLAKGYIGFLLNPIGFLPAAVDYAFNNVNSLFVFLAAHSLVHEEDDRIQKEMNQAGMVTGEIVFALFVTLVLSAIFHKIFKYHAYHDAILAIPPAIISFFILLYFTFNLLNRIVNRRFHHILFFIFSLYAGLQLVYFHFFLEGYPELLIYSLFLTAICLKIICSIMVFISRHYINAT